MLRVDRAGVVSQTDAAVELEITHSTRYEFSKPVFLEPHVMRFQPRADGAQMPLEFDLEIDPVPAGRSACLDASGNVAEQVWFDGLHESLSITARSVVAMLRENPFDFLPDGSRTRLPAFYGDDVDSLRPYLRREAPHQGPDDVAVFAARMQAAARGELLSFVGSLNQTMFERLELVRREEGSAWTPAQTWREKRGACRDLAWLFVDVCRAAGIAARFVSGYEDAIVGRENYDLHAWAEVFIPGGGWRGYDPARGLAIGMHHVAVAAAASPAGAAPVTGTFRGDDATSTFSTLVNVETCAAVAIGA